MKEIKSSPSKKEDSKGGDNNNKDNNTEECIFLGTFRIITKYITNFLRVIKNGCSPITENLYHKNIYVLQMPYTFLKMGPQYQFLDKRASPPQGIWKSKIFCILESATIAGLTLQMMSDQDFISIKGSIFQDVIPGDFVNYKQNIVTATFQTAANNFVALIFFL